MGGSVSRAVVQKATRPIKNYNVQNRAEKVIEKHKTNPKPAPKHASTEQLLKKHAEDNPHVKEEIEKKDFDTIARMNKLKLEVTGKNPEIIASNPERPLPQSRSVPVDPLLMTEKPESVPLGKLSLFQASEILSKHKKAPTEYTAKVIAKEYNLDLDQTYCILQYFYSLDMEDSQLLDLSAVQQSLIKKMLIYSTPEEKKTKS